jgi:hypothetical protein
MGISLFRAHPLEALPAVCWQVAERAYSFF